MAYFLSVDAFHSRLKIKNQAHLMLFACKFKADDLNTSLGIKDSKYFQGESKFRPAQKITSGDNNWIWTKAARCAFQSQEISLV